MTLITLNLKPITHLSKAEFCQLSSANPDLKLEMTPLGELVIMSPTGGETGYKNLLLTAKIANWTISNATGIAFDSSTMFEMPNGAFRSPDGAWIALERWNTLTESQKQGFPPLAPDFVIELRSPSDTLKPLQEKMSEYIANGVRLAWLIDPQKKQVEIYRQDQEKEVLVNPTQLSGENVLPGLIVDLTNIL